jgi:hypothetical protein
MFNGDEVEYQRPQLWQKDAPIKVDVMARDFGYGRSTRVQAMTDYSCFSFDIPATYHGSDRLEFIQ